MKRPSVLLTGAAGICGTALQNLGYPIVSYDRAPGTERHGVRADLLDEGELAQAMSNCWAVLHFAGATKPTDTWERVLRDNVEATRLVLEIARAQGVDRVVLASTNHVVGGHELAHAPGCYEPGHSLVVDKDSPPFPDSYYGLSKLMCEELGRYLANTGGPRVYALRIGAVRPAGDDHPLSYAEAGVRDGRWTRNSGEYRMQEQRLRALWLSRRDLVQLVDRCLTYEGPVFDVFYGVSDNAARWLDIEHARQALGYRPLDDGASVMVGGYAPVQAAKPEEPRQDAQ